MNKQGRQSVVEIVYYLVSFLLWGAYMYITFTAPINRTSTLLQGVSDIQVRLIQISVALPIFMTWALGLYGGVRLNRYANSIQGSSEAKGLRMVSYGIMALVLGIAANQAMGSLKSLYLNNPAALETIIIAANYLKMIVTLLPFAIMLWGSRALLKSMNIKPKERFNLFFPAFSLVVTASLYLLLYVLDPARQTSSVPSVTPTYYLSDGIVILTIVVPYFIAWWMGFLAILNMETYMEQINGVLYKKSFERFLIGFITIVMASIVFQIVSTMASKLIQIGLGPILILIYILLAILAAGYIIIALGARRLDKIETV